MIPTSRLQIDVKVELYNDKVSTKIVMPLDPNDPVSISEYNNRKYAWLKPRGRTAKPGDLVYIYIVSRSNKNIYARYHAVALAQAGANQITLRNDIDGKDVTLKTENIGEVLVDFNKLSIAEIEEIRDQLREEGFALSRNRDRENFVAYFIWKYLKRDKDRNQILEEAKEKVKQAVAPLMPEEIDIIIQVLKGIRKQKIAELIENSRISSLEVRK